MCDEKRIARPVGGHRPEQRHHVQPLAWVHAVERFVEQQDARVVDERRGELRALAHALGVGPDRSVGGVVELDRGDRPVRGRTGVGDRLELGVEPHELVTGEVARDGLAFGHQPDVAVDARVAERGRPADAHDPGRRSEQTREQVEQRRLAGPVRPEQAGHPRSQGERDVVDRDDVAVPARDVLDLQGGNGRAGRRGLGRHPVTRR